MKKTYYESNKEARRAYGRQHYRDNKKACQKASKKYRKGHVEALRVYNHKYYLVVTKPTRIKKLKSQRRMSTV